MNKTDRLMAIILLLRSRSQMRAEELARTFEVTERTIYRDIQSLMLAGIPIISLPGPNGGYSIMKSYNLPPVMFTSEEAAALFLGGKIIAGQEGTPYREAVKTGLLKIEAILPEDIKDYVYEIERQIAFDIHPRINYSAFTHTLSVINQAIIKKRSVWMVYYTFSRDEIVARKVDPYGMFYKNGVWYLVGYCHWRDDIRFFRVDRIRELSLAENRFKLPPDFSIREHIEQMDKFLSGEERIGARFKFDSEVAKWIRDSWVNKPESLRDTEDGGVILSLSIPKNDLGYWMGYVLSWGGHVEIIEPEDLREMIVEEGKKIIDIYQKAGR